MLVGATWFIIYFVLGLQFSHNSLLILLGVILLHELGHILAMLIFRYRDMQILSVPLFGWADPAGKRSTKGVAKWKQVIVYLMGPVPGIVIGLAMIVVNKNIQFPLMYEAAAVLVLFNYLHMLPFMSLDGGRIMRLVAMERFPFSKLLFPLASGGLFAAGGYYLGEPVFWALCMIIIASIPFGVRQSAVLRAVHKVMKDQRKKDPNARDFHSLDTNNKLARIFLALKRPRFRKLNFLLKYQLVQALDGIVHQPQKSSGATSLVLLGVYLAALVLTPQAILVTAQQNGQTPELQSTYWGQKAKTDLESRISRAATPQQRFTLLINAADNAMVNGQFSKAAGYLKRAGSTQRHINNDSTLAHLSFSYAGFHLQNNQLDDAVRYQQKAIALYEKKPKAHYFQLAKSYEQLSEIQLKQQQNYDSEASLQKALSFAIKTRKPEQWYMITKLSGRLLDWYYLEERQGDANRLLNSLMSRFKQNETPLKDYVARFVYEEMGWLHAAANDEKAAMDKFDKALALSEKYASQQKNKQSDGRETTKLLLAKAAVYYKEGYNDFSRIQFSNAEDAARESSFVSLEQYIDKYAPKNLSVELKNDYHREAKRWKLITDAYRKTHSS
jgi:Zn-dependent protease/tetratricopeptide (TPR) repeat protein